MDRVVIQNPDCFSLDRTLLCGQCFRFGLLGKNKYEIIAGNRRIVAEQQDNYFIIEGTDRCEYENFWRQYFDMDREYEALDKLLCTDRVLAMASPYAKGIHILKQDPFETLCSFIISQNNNIPRIKGIISRLCELCGESISDNCFAFPTADKLARLSVEDLAPIRSGFRAKYLVDAAQKVSLGQIDLSLPYGMPLEEAQNYLMQIKGVGPKVADCVLLFAYGRFDSFPKDVWIKRIMEENYPDGLPDRFDSVKGIAQQYLFHFFRNEQN